MKIPDGRIEYLDGHLWKSLDGPNDQIMRDYELSVANGTCPADEFWEMTTEEYGHAAVATCQALIDEGALIKAPDKPAADAIVHDGWYWLQHGRSWEIGQADADDGLRFRLTSTEVSVPYREIMAVGPLIEVHDDQREEADHDHAEGDCPLCPSSDQLASMRDANRERERSRRAALLTEITAKPSAFVHIVEGYENADDRSPIVTFVAGTLLRAKQHLDTYRSSEGNIFEVTPHRIDADRTGETVMFHAIKRNGVLVMNDGRFYPEKPDQ